MKKKRNKKESDWWFMASSLSFEHLRGETINHQSGFKNSTEKEKFLM